MTRVRTDNVFGTLTDDPLTNVATTMNSAGLTNLAVVGSPDVAVITLDPNRVNGAPEIVHVTAHTGSATSATILRGQEGTAAREHPQGTFWAHAATATDFGTDWDTWTPTLTNLTLGNGTVDAKFTQIGDTVMFGFLFTLGSTSAVGTAPTFSLPVNADAPWATPFHTIGQGMLLDTGINNYPCSMEFATPQAALFRLMNATGTSVVSAAVTATVPFTWGTDDALQAAGYYKAA